MVFGEMLYGEVHQLRLEPSGVNVNAPYGHGQREPPRPRATWVQIHDSVLLLKEGLVGMAGDHGFDIGFGQIEIQLLEIVENIQRNASDRYNLGTWQSLRPWAFVIISSDCYDRRNPLEFFQHLGLSNISSMDNQRGPFESRKGFWPEKPVGVGDDPYDLTVSLPPVG